MTQETETPEDFSFDDSSTGETVSELLDAEEAQKPKGNGLWILSALLLAGAGGSGYWYWKHRMVPASPPALEAPEHETPITIAPAPAPAPAPPPVSRPTPPVIVAPTPPLPAAAPTPLLDPAMASQLQTILDTVLRLEQRSTESAAQAQFLESGLQQLATNLQALQENISTQETDIAQLQDLGQKIAQDVETLLQPPAPATPVLPPIAATPAAPSLSVHAIIPGRVWLKDPSGKILTYTEGDPVPPYGTVVFIDPRTLVVNTSSGVVLR